MQTKTILTITLFTIMGGAFLAPTRANSYLSDLNTRLLYLNTLYEPPVASQEALVTAYSSLDSCHYANCAMASTKPAYVGAIACPRSIPLFTQVIIDNITYTCEDRTAKKYDGRFDIFMGYGKEAHQQAVNFGLKNLEVSQITP
jgi:3D (Asp-Asp-Asp) domain-containing protein